MGIPQKGHFYFSAKRVQYKKTGSHSGWLPVNCSIQGLLSMSYVTTNVGPRAGINMRNIDTARARAGIEVRSTEVRSRKALHTRYTTYMRVP